MKLSSKLLVALISISVFGITSYCQTQRNWVDGQLIEYNNNGAWCWFQDERVVVDTSKSKLIIGSTGSGGSIDVVIYDITNRKIDSKTQIGKLTSDDHNVPGLLIQPKSGGYIAMFADHYDKYYSRYCIYNGQKWSSEKRFDWTKIPGGTDYTIAYSNLYYLSSEDRIYNMARANDRAPNFIYSDDEGNTWNFGGQLTTNSSSSYNKGYYKY